MTHPVQVWTSKTYYVDIDTGEELTKHQATTNYYTITTTKKTTYNERKTRGHNEFTKQCRRKPKQGNLFNT